MRKTLLSLLLVLTMVTSAFAGVGYSDMAETWVQSDELIVTEDTFEFDTNDLFDEFLRADGEAASSYGLFSIDRAGQNLSEVNRAIYLYVSEELDKIVDGERFSTEFTLPSDTVSALNIVTTAEAAGVENFAELTDAERGNIAKNLIASKVTSKSIMRALFNDAPFEFFWYNGSLTISFKYSYNEEYIKITTIICRIPVATEYRNSDAETPQYTISADIMDSVAVTRSEAARVVEEYKDLGDYEKLDAYRAYIMDRVSYDYDTYNNALSVNYGDPWQILRVFDNRRSDKIVCEGYAKAFQYLCDMSSFTHDVTCYSIQGYITTSPRADTSGLYDNHLWNAVKFNDEVYLVDITNCDIETNPAYPTGLFMKAASEAMHTKDTGYRMPVEYNGNTYSYYYYNPNSAYKENVLTIATHDFSSKYLHKYIKYEDYNDEQHKVICIGDDDEYFKEHNLVLTEEKEAVSEQEPGYKKYVCSDCGHEYIEEVLHEHAYSTEYSHDEHYHWFECSCGDISEKAEHSFIETEVITAPTEEAEGLSIFTCEVCGYSVEMVTSLTAEPHIHDYIYEKDAEGHTAICTICSHALEKEAHTFVDEVINEASHTEDGKVVHTCSVCGYSYEETIPKIAHNWSSWVKNGSENHKRTCFDCGEVEFESHSFKSEVTKAATTTSTGIKTYTCRVCGYSYTKVIDKIKETAPATSGGSGGGESSAGTSNTAVDIKKDANTVTEVKTETPVDTATTTPLTEDTTIKYDDVDSDAWYAEAVNTVTEKGLMNGIGDNKFDPLSYSTREQFMTVLARMKENPKFTLEEGLKWATDNGISDGLYPTNVITREELVTMLYRLSGTAVTDELTFMDSDMVSPWAVDAMKWAVKEGIITGVGDNTLDPRGLVTRAQLATILSRISSEN